MDYREERDFVRSFIRKERRERLLFELTTPKRRYEGLDRFCHHAPDLLDPKKIALEGKDLTRSPAFLRFAAEHDAICLLLSPDAALDGIRASLREAVGLAAQCFDAVLILGDGFAVVFGESMKGGRDQFLLTERPLPPR